MSTGHVLCDEIQLHGLCRLCNAGIRNSAGPGPSKVRAWTASCSLTSASSARGMFRSSRALPSIRKDAWPCPNFAEASVSNSLTSCETGLIQLSLGASAGFMVHREREPLAVETRNGLKRWNPQPPGTTGRTHSFEAPAVPALPPNWSSAWPREEPSKQHSLQDTRGHTYGA